MRVSVKSLRWLGIVAAFLLSACNTDVAYTTNVQAYDATLKGDHEESVRLLTIGAERGYMVSQFDLGYKYQRCDGASVQDQKDKELILKTADAPRTPGTVLRSHDPLWPMRPQAINQRTEGARFNTRQGAKLPFGNKPRAVKLRHWKSLLCSSVFESHAG